MNFLDYQGDGLIHRLSPKLKLGALFTCSILLFAISSPAVLGLLAGIVVFGAYIFCREAIWQWMKSWPLLLTIAAVVMWTAYSNGFDAALVVALRLGALSLFATIVTCTTSIGQFIETVTKLAQPLEKIGIGNAADIGLAIGLVIRFVPDVYEHYKSVAEAHRARGLRLRFSTIIVPMLIGTMLKAEEIANAIDARAIRSDQSEQK